MRLLLGILAALVALGAAATPAAAERPSTLVGFGAASYTAGESSTTVDVAVQRSGNGRSSVDVVAGAGGTATGGTMCATGVDFVAPPEGSRLTFTRADAATVTVELCPDGTDEPDETIVLRLANPSRGLTVDGTGETVITITDDDAAAAACADDAVSDDSLQTATAIVSGVTYQRVSCPGNSDWFALGQRVENVSITKTGVVDVIVYDADHVPLYRLDWQHDTAQLPISIVESLSFEVVQPFPTGSQYSLTITYSTLLPTTG